ncbi:uncharacterized protein [Pocillopora verrucosa]|uniref:uncharacterized protein n=1 Tax=Pocillopora verrucosa TaxID=203993 RepID=UPI003342B4E9
MMKMRLKKCVEEGNIAELRKLLEQSSNPEELVNKKLRQNKTALHIAVEKGHEEIVEYLLEKGADIHATDDFGCTALHVAASNRKENFNIAQLILNCEGVKVNALEENENTPLKLAAEKGHINIVKKLISMKADVNKADKGDSTPLHVAAKKSHDQTLELLLKEVEDGTIGKQTKEKMTALHFAVESKNERCVALLLNQGASVCVHSKNEQGRTPLDIANDDPKENIIEFLKDPKKANEFLGRHKTKARLGKGGSVESDSITPHNAAHQGVFTDAIQGLQGVIPPLSSNGSTPATQVIQFTGAVNIRNVTVKDGATANIDLKDQVNITQPNSGSNASPQQHSGESQINVVVRDEAHAVIGDNGVMNVNTAPSSTPSPGDQENRDPHGGCPPETGAPVENSHGPPEASFPPLEEPPREENRGALLRWFAEEPPPRPDDKSLAQPLQEEFPSEKRSGGLFHPIQEELSPRKDQKSLPHPIQEESPSDKTKGASLISVQEVPLPKKNEQSLAQPVQEESRSDKDSGTLPLPVQEDCPLGKGQPVQEDAAKDEGSGTSQHPVQEDSSLGKNHPSLAQPVQEEAPREKGSGALTGQVHGDFSQNLEAQSGERAFQDGKLAEGDTLHRVTLRGGLPLPQTTPRNRGVGIASHHNSSENARVESSIGEVPHRTERHSRDNSPSATIDLGDLDCRPDGVQDENPDDDKGSHRVCNCIGM